MTSGRCSQGLASTDSVIIVITVKTTMNARLAISSKKNYSLNLMNKISKWWDFRTRWLDEMTDLRGMPSAFLLLLFNRQNHWINQFKNHFCYYCRQQRIDSLFMAVVLCRHYIIDYHYIMLSHSTHVVLMGNLLEISDSDNKWKPAVH